MCFFSFVEDTTVVRVTVHEPPPDVFPYYPIYLNQLLEPVILKRMRSVPVIHNHNIREQAQHSNIMECVVYRTFLDLLPDFGGSG